jgi:hypothetical protein
VTISAHILTNGLTKKDLSTLSGFPLLKLRSKILLVRLSS